MSEHGFPDPPPKAEGQPGGGPGVPPVAAAGAMGGDGPAEAEARAARIAEQEAALRRFAALLVGAGVLLLGGALAWRGVDFAGAVLLGILIVLLNFYWTKKAVKSVLLAGQPKTLLGLSFLLKFGVTAAVLFYAIVYLAVDGLGVLIGLSALVLASAAFALRQIVKHG